MHERKSGNIQLCFQLGSIPLIYFCKKNCGRIHDQFMFFPVSFGVMLADVLNVSPSSEQTECLWGNMFLNIFKNSADRKVTSCHWLEFVVSKWRVSVVK